MKPALMLFLGMAVASCASAQEDPIAQRLVGSWRLAKYCQYERGSPDTDPCSPMTSMAEWLRFDPDGTVWEMGVDGASGRYRIERRELTGGREEVLLRVGNRNYGQLGFVGDTLVLGLAYVDGPDRYFVRRPDLGR